MALFGTKYKNIRIICLNTETVSAVISYGDDGGVEGDKVCQVDYVHLEANLGYIQSYKN